MDAVALNFTTPYRSSEELENKWNPLHCHLCHEQYQEPCILQCYHSFCSGCLENKVEGGKLACPLCGQGIFWPNRSYWQTVQTLIRHLLQELSGLGLHCLQKPLKVVYIRTVTLMKEESVGPPSDALLKFLVESSSGDKTPCANCDQVQPQMYFCSTCSQSLCVQCREETHQAKMFQSHEVLLQTKHTRDIQKQCGIHKEPYILFSTEKKVMLCINCFRDMKVESRSHCVDLETAYKQGCQKLDDTMQSIRDLQNSVRDGILLLRALLEEIESNVEKEKGDIRQLYDTMQEKISETKESLLTEIDRQYEEKVELFKNQLISLTTFLPTLHVHLVTCAAFSSSANKYEFLDFTYGELIPNRSHRQTVQTLIRQLQELSDLGQHCLQKVLMKRLMSIIQVQHPLHPSQTSDIVTDYKSKFAKCLEPLLFPYRNGAPVTVANPIVPSVACTRYDVSPCINSPAVNSLGNQQASEGSPGTSKNSHSKKKFKLKLMETKGFFADHCKEFDTSHREFMVRVDGIKQSVQEVQRDITLRRSLTREVTIKELKTSIDQADEGLAVHQVNLEGRQGGLEKHWEESLERIAAEQEVYQAQLQDIARLKNEVASVKVILQKLSSFVTSIASVTQRLAPKLSKATLTLEQDNTHAAILQEINTMQPDSQQRVDAISKAEEVRDIRSANRVNPLDEELIKTKGLLRAPSLRKESTMKRLSAEIKDIKIEPGDIDKPEIDEEKSENKSTENPPESVGKEPQDGDKKASNEDSVKVKLNPDDEEVVEGIHQNGDKPVCDSVAETDGLEGKSATETTVDSTCESVSNDVDNNDLSFQSNCKSLPDVMIQVNEVSESVTGESQDINKDIHENGEINAEFTVDMTNSELSSSESDFNTSIESYQSSEESVKPGLVKDLVAMVVKRTKPLAVSITESSDVIAPTNKSPKFRALQNDQTLIQTDASGKINGLCDGMDNKSEVIPESIEQEVESGKECIGISPEKEGKLHGINDFVTPTADSASADDDEVYVAKSLPELAQVFEPGELKQKRKRSRSARTKDQNNI